MKMRTLFLSVVTSLSLSTYAYSYSYSWVEDASYQQTIHDFYHAPREIVAYADAYYYSDSPRRYSRHRHHISTPPHLSANLRTYGNKLIIVDPNVHTWSAYSNGELIRSGLASAGAKWCPDIGRACRTKSGVFRIYSLGDSQCVSKRYPVGVGGAPMPYCMYFNGNQGLHGSHELARANISHGCVRMSVDDARWLRYDFVTYGTKVIVKPY